MGNLSKTFGKLTIPLFLLLAICFWASPAYAKYGGGTGEPNDPYLIFDANQMNAIGADSNDWDKHFKLMADIDLSAYTGTSFNIIGTRYNPFTGVFDGNDHTISNFSYTFAGRDYTGLFGYVSDANAEIRYLRLIDPNVDAGTGNIVGSLVGSLREGKITGCYVEGGSISGIYGVGGLVGDCWGTITNCYSTGRVWGDWSVGGLVGYNYDGTISNCHSSGRATGNHRVGGLVGWNYDHGTITSCYSTGSVTGGEIVGGLAGYNDYGTIANCYAEAGSVTGDDVVGGLVGNNRGTITNCYSEGDVSGNRYVGGLVGTNGFCYPWGGCFPGTVSHCYSIGSVTGDSRVGGLVGMNYGIITNCYSTGSVAGDWLVGGLVGQNEEGTISDCYSTGSVAGYGYVGGLAGVNVGTISNCYSEGAVTGGERVGGLVGENWYGTITNCYATGSVSGDEEVGGLVGRNASYGQVMHSFWDIETSGQMTSDGGTGLPTTEMQMQVTFTDAGWGCGTVWTIDEGNDYPRLRWENAPGETITTPSYGGGSGEPNDPYLIYTAEQLNTIGLVPCHLDKHFILMADIDLSVFTGTAFNIIANFTGVFDGNGHTISNFSYTSTGRNYLGLFGYIDGGEVRNLGLEGGSVSGRYYVGGLAGYNTGTITNCYSTGSVAGHYNVGGLVGFNDGTITNCYSTASVSGTGWDAGGLVGQNDATISNCYSTASVSGNKYVGGLVGENCGTITDCSSTGTVNGNRSVGGLVGVHNRGTITDSFSRSSVEGTERVGGLVGYNQGASIITNCYSTGSVAGTWAVGGLVGINYYYSATISYCYSIGSVSGDNYVGGLVGYNYYGKVIASFWDIETSGQTTSDGGTGKTTTEMQTQSTFTDAGWDFVGETFNGIDDIWFIPHQDYPHLWWEGMQVPMKLTPRTLNCRSKGNWVKAHLTLPEGFTVADVDPDRPAVLHSFGFESAPLYVSVNENELVEIEAAFEREAVCSLTGDWPEALTVAGFLTDGNIFLGTSTVRMITPGLKDIEELALYWLNADCVQPDFCGGIDLNRDSMVNLLDYALLLNSQVEFIRE